MCCCTYVSLLYCGLCVKHLTIISASNLFAQLFCSSLTTQIFRVELTISDATFLFLGFFAQVGNIYFILFGFLLVCQQLIVCII
jgi:hypothetical protein